MDPNPLWQLSDPPDSQNERVLTRLLETILPGGDLVLMSGLSDADHPSLHFVVNPRASMAVVQHHGELAGSSRPIRRGRRWRSSSPCTAGQPEVQTLVFDVPLGPGKHPGPGIRISHSAVNLNGGWITETEGNGGEVSFRRAGREGGGVAAAVMVGSWRIAAGRFL